jgi:hypothetical protein
VASLRLVNQVRKNANQTPPRINTARQILIVSIASTDGPDSAWRASVGVSMIMPCFLFGTKTLPQIFGAWPARSNTGTFSTSSGEAPEGVSSVA